MARQDRDQEKFARESFTLRRPQAWQTWAIATVVAIAAVVLLLYGLS